MDHLEAIKQLKARYFRTMDTTDGQAMREVFAADVVADASASGGGVVEGADGAWRIKRLTPTRLRPDVTGPDANRSEGRTA